MVKDGILVEGTIIDGKGVISNLVTEICDWAFADKDLCRVSIPYGVKRIGNNAFRGSSIECIDIPSSVTEIGDFAFADCPELVTICIPNSVKTIGVGLFIGSTALREYWIPNEFKDKFGWHCSLPMYYHYSIGGKKIDEWSRAVSGEDGDSNAD